MRFVVLLTSDTTWYGYGSPGASGSSSSSSSRDGSAFTLADGEVVSAAGTDALVVVSASAARTERITGQIRSTVGRGELILSAFGGSGSVVTEAGSGAGARPTGSTNGSGVAFSLGERGDRSYRQ